MREAEITCLCSPGVQIADLGLSLKRGDVIYLSEDKIRRSQHLETVRRANGVSVRWVERCREKREPKIEAPFMAPVSSSPSPVLGVPLAPIPETSSGLPLDMVELEALLKRVVSPLIEQVSALRQEIAQRPSVVMAREAVPVSSRPSIPGSGTVASEAPLFIPSDLVNSGLKADIAFVEKEQSVGGLDSATEALKALKKKR